MCQWQVERFEMGRSHQGQFMALSIKREALCPTGSINWEPMLLPFVFTVCEFSHWWKNDPETQKHASMETHGLWNSLPSWPEQSTNSHALPSKKYLLTVWQVSPTGSCLDTRTPAGSIVSGNCRAFGDVGSFWERWGDYGEAIGGYADFLAWVKLPAPWCSCASCPLRRSHCRGWSSLTTMPPLQILKWLWNHEPKQCFPPSTVW